MQSVASTINTLVGALYKVFCDQCSKEMRQACFDYLSIGGCVLSDGAVALFSGLNLVHNSCFSISLSSLYTVLVSWSLTLTISFSKTHLDRS